MDPLRYFLMINITLEESTRNAAKLHIIYMSQRGALSSAITSYRPSLQHHFEMNRSFKSRY